MECLSAEWPSGSKRRFYDGHVRKVDCSTSIQASLLCLRIRCFTTIISAWWNQTDSGFVLRIAPPSHSRDMRTKIKKKSNQINDWLVDFFIFISHWLILRCTQAVKKSTQVLILSFTINNLISGRWRNKEQTKLLKNVYSEFPFGNKTIGNGGPKHQSSSASKYIFPVEKNFFYCRAWRDDGIVFQKQNFQAIAAEGVVVQTSPFFLS